MVTVLALNASVAKLNLRGNGLNAAPLDKLLDFIDFLSANNFTIVFLEVDPGMTMVVR